MYIAEHVEHFIGTLDDRDLDKKLTLLRLEDADEMEETLCAYQSMENRQIRSSTESNKFRSRPTPDFHPTAANPVRAVRTLRVEIEDSGPDSDLSGSNGEEEPRHVLVAATSYRTKKVKV